MSVLCFLALYDEAEWPSSEHYNLLFLLVLCQSLAHFFGNILREEPVLCLGLLGISFAFAS